MEYYYCYTFLFVWFVAIGFNANKELIRSALEKERDDIIKSRDEIIRNYVETIIRPSITDFSEFEVRQIVKEFFMSEISLRRSNSPMTYLIKRNIKFSLEELYMRLTEQIIQYSAVRDEDTWKIGMRCFIGFPKTENKEWKSGIDNLVQQIIRGG